jgi:signal transduction histidine kinase
MGQHDGVFTMRIRDDGNGFAPLNPTRGQGLRNMRERIEKMGGTLAVSSTAGEGTEVVVTVPVEKRETDE